MRLISKDGRFDFPYGNSMIEKFEGAKFMIKVNEKVFATYNTKEAMTMEIERLWNAFRDGEKVFIFS